MPTLIHQVRIEFSFRNVNHLSITGKSVSTGGSWAGGYLYILAGAGMVPDGGSDTVTVTFGEYPFGKSCAIVETTFEYISCLVPDFTSLKGSDTSKVVPVKINLGYDQLAPQLKVYKKR